MRGISCFHYREQQAQGIQVSVPLRGVGCFLHRIAAMQNAARRFRPLAGCRLFLLQARRLALGGVVSVPLRGVGCFPRKISKSLRTTKSLHPLAGCELFLRLTSSSTTGRSFRPLAGCGLFPHSRWSNRATPQFPSPCGVWVVSAILYKSRNGVDFAVVLYV